MHNKTYLSRLSYAVGIEDLTPKVKAVSTSGGSTILEFSPLLDIGATKAKIKIGSVILDIEIENSWNLAKWRVVKSTSTNYNALIQQPVKLYAAISAIEPEDIPNFGQVLGAINSAINANQPILCKYQAVNGHTNRKIMLVSETGYTFSNISAFKNVANGGLAVNVDIILNAARTQATVYVPQAASNLYFLMIITQTRN